MTVFPEQPYWGEHCAEADIEGDEETRRLLGAKAEYEEEGEDGKVVTYSLNENGEKLIGDFASHMGDARINGDVRSITATQLMRHLKVAGPRRDLILPEACDKRPRQLSTSTPIVD